MTAIEIAELIKAHMGSDQVLGIDENATPHAIVLAKNALLPACGFLAGHENLYFDSLSCLTAIDNGEEKGTMELAYNLYSIPFHISVMLKVSIAREIEEGNLPRIASVTSIWKAADWQEREAYDLFGINFVGHPDLRRILLPTDWEGYPLRKDYQHQDKYHGITVKY